MSDHDIAQTHENLDPIVIKIKNKKKKKRRYSSGLKDLQESGRGMARVSSRVLRSVYRGMEEFRKASDKSSYKKRDGAIHDLGLNLAKASSKTLRVSARIPTDLAKAMNRKTGRRVLRQQIRLMSRANRRFGWR